MGSKDRSRAGDRCANARSIDLKLDPSDALRGLSVDAHCNWPRDCGISQRAYKRYRGRSDSREAAEEETANRRSRLIRVDDLDLYVPGDVPNFINAAVEISDRLCIEHVES